MIFYDSYKTAVFSSAPGREDSPIMKHTFSTYQTKRAMAASLKAIMEKKPLSKITISEVIAHCGVNRKTFYYHFDNIYALLQWMLEEETTEVLRHYELPDDLEEVISFVLDYTEANKHILSCIYDTMGREEMNRFFHSSFIETISRAIDRSAEALSLSVDAEFRKFLASFMAEAIAGVIIAGFRNDSHLGREETVKNISLICRTAVPSILLAKVNGISREGVPALPRKESETVSEATTA